MEDHSQQKPVPPEAVEEGGNDTGVYRAVMDEDTVGTWKQHHPSAPSVQETVRLPTSPWSLCRCPQSKHRFPL